MDAAPSDKNLTLDDVARVAGVSKMTASRAMRGSPECSASTRARVLAAAEQIGYRPNPIVTLFHEAVHGRRSEYTATIGWLNDFPQARHHERTLHLRRMLRGAQRRSTARGFKLDEIWFEGAAELPVARRTARYAQILRARGAPGLILPILCQGEVALQPWADLSVACVGGVVPPSMGADVTTAFPELFHHVQPDFFANVELACTALRARGYRRIGLFIADWHNRHTGRHYEASFRLQSADWGDEQVPPLITPEPCSEAEQERALVAWVRQHRPDVVLCGLGPTCAWLRRAGWRIPADIGVAHIWLSDDTEDWSGVDPDLEAIGAAAVDLVLTQVQANNRGRPPKVHRLSFLGSWVNGSTTR